MRHHADQLSLFEPPRQPRRRETARVYAAVRALRAAGVSVHAQGRNHRVGGGKLMSDRELLRYARDLVGGRQ